MSSKRSSPLTISKSGTAQSVTLSPVEKSLHAYNAKDIEAFIRCFSPQSCIWIFGRKTPLLRGRPAIRAFYESQRFNIAGLHASVTARLELPGLVIDRECITGLAPQPQEALIVYRVTRGLISGLWYVEPPVRQASADVPMTVHGDAIEI